MEFTLTWEGNANLEWGSNKLLCLENKSEDTLFLFTDIDKVTSIDYMKNPRIVYTFGQFFFFCVEDFLKF